MGKKMSIFELADLVYKRPGNDIIFSLVEGGEEYAIARTKSVGVVISSTSYYCEAFAMPGWEKTTPRDFALSIEPYLRKMAEMFDERYLRNSITVISMR